MGICTAPGWGRPPSMLRPMRNSTSRISGRDRTESAWGTRVRRKSSWRSNSCR